MMNSKKNEKPFQTDLWEKWLESFFLDPFTSLLDQTQFRVDLFDSDTEVIIEAMLPKQLSSEIDIFLKDSSIVIKVVHPPYQPKERTITFPFFINAQKVEATYSNEILEIIVSKTKQVKPIFNRKISLTQ
jgi:HSP20 family molecular chaperone IbpA